MKFYALLPVLALTACVQTVNPYADDMDVRENTHNNKEQRYDDHNQVRHEPIQKQNQYMNQNRIPVSTQSGYSNGYSQTFQNGPQHSINPQEKMVPIMPNNAATGIVPIQPMPSNMMQGQTYPAQQMALNQGGQLPSVQQMNGYQNYAVSQPGMGMPSEQVMPQNMPVQMNANQPVQDQGTTIEVPAQQIYIPRMENEAYDSNLMVTAAQGQVQAPIQQPMTEKTISGQNPSLQQMSGQAVGYQQQILTTDQGQYAGTVDTYVQMKPQSVEMMQNNYYTTPSPAMPQKEGALITLQHPTQKTMVVQCPANDMRCIQAYEGQGFVRVGQMPQFAGYQEKLSVSDYPAGQWRNQNNIPRW